VARSALAFIFLTPDRLPPAHEEATVATILEKRQRLSAISDRQKALKSNYEKNKSFSQEERDETKALSAEVETLKAEIAALEAQEAEDRKFLSDADALAADLNKPLPRQTQPDTLGAKFNGTAADVKVKDPAKFKTLGEQLQAIAGAGMIGDHPGSRDNRLVWNNLSAASGSAQASVPSDGGYLIQKDFTTELLSKVNDTSTLKMGVQDVFKGIRMIPIGEGFDGLNAPTIDETSRATGSRWGGVQMYWGAENDTATAKKPKLRFMQMELIDLIGLAYASNRLLRDASAMQSIFMQAFTEETTFMLEDAFRERQRRWAAARNPQQPGSRFCLQGNRPGRRHLVKENIDKMWSRMWARSPQNAVWLINQDVEPQLANLNQGVGVGGVPVYLPPGGLADAPFARLKGRPLFRLNTAPRSARLATSSLPTFSKSSASTRTRCPRIARFTFAS
jgi:HK97 family phage major capsid protein